jgi:glutamyl-tRNA reductase
MQLVALGVNHKTATVDVREKLALNDEITHSACVSGVVLLSTCNRTEIYVETSSWRSLLTLLSKNLRLDINAFKKYTYVHFDIEAVIHLMQVASGLDSMVLGEVEIFGQLKAAYQLAQRQGCVTPSLGRLFEHAFSAAKKVRTQTEIGMNPISVAYLAVRLAERIFTRISDQTVLLIGAGDTALLILKHLNSAGVTRFIIANRTLAHSQSLARAVSSSASVELIELGMVPEFLSRADVVIAATGAPLPIVGKGMVEGAIKARKYKSMFMIDLSVPRNIEPQVQQIPDVYLYGIDDLQNIAAEHRRSRATAIPQADMIIASEAKKFMAWLQSRDSINTIKAFRSRCEERRDQALLEALRQLDNGFEPKEVLQRFAHVLLNRLIHEPTVQLRRASVAGNLDLLTTVHELLTAEI